MAKAKTTVDTPPPKSRASRSSGNAALPPSSWDGSIARPVRERPPPSPEAVCRTKKAYPAYREEQQALIDKGDVSRLVEECKAHGVGSHLWPVTQYRPPLENMQALTTGAYGKRNVHEGKQCMDRVMWEDKSFKTLLNKLCPGNDGYEKFQQRLKREKEQQAQRALRPARSASSQPRKSSSSTDAPRRSVSTRAIPPRSGAL